MLGRWEVHLLDRRRHYEAIFVSFMAGWEVAFPFNGSKRKQFAADEWVACQLAGGVAAEIPVATEFIYNKESCSELERAFREDWVRRHLTHMHSDAPELPFPKGKDSRWTGARS